MTYLLVVVTHGDSLPLLRTLPSFVKYVKPKPTHVFLHHDGPVNDRVIMAAEQGAEVSVSSPQVGFCEATARAWKRAGVSEQTHVFWLEHDFLFTRPVDVDAMARVMAAQSVFNKNPLAQMALMRGPVNHVEVAAGGLYESRRDEYVNEGLWMSHSSYFTTNPCLMTVPFVRDHRWPAGPECEGRFGIELVDEGFRFGVWGHGEPWVDHIGVRSGVGY